MRSPRSPGAQPPGQAVTLKDACRYLPRRNGKKVHYATVYRWATKGARGRVLETTMVGGVRYTTMEAIARFTKLESDGEVNSEEAQRLAEVQRALDEAGL